MVVIAEETRNRIPTHRSVAVAVAQAELVAMGQLVLAAAQQFQIFTLEALCSMALEVAARVATPEPSQQVDQVLVVMAELIQRDRRPPLIQEVVAVAVVPQAQLLVLADSELMALLSYVTV